MEELRSFINTLKSDRRLSNFDEAATKQVIVLRLLSILGWDTFDIDEVTPEYSVRTLKVDYSLRLNHTNKVFIEVKKISEDLEKHQEQLLNYAFQEGVKLAILTNGVSWWYYLPLNEGSWEQQKFYTIDLLQQDTDDISEKFDNLLSKEKVLSGEAIKNADSIYRGRQKTYIVKETIPKAWNKIISEPDEFIVELLIENIEKLSGFRPDSKLVEKFLSQNSDKLILSEEPEKKPISTIKRVKRSGRTRTRYTLSVDYTGQKVTSFSLFGSTYQVKNWRDLLTSLIDLVRSKKAGDFDKVLSLVGRKRPYFTHNSHDLRGPFKINETNIYVETNLSSNSIVKLCKAVLNVFGYDPDSLQVHAN